MLLERTDRQGHSAQKADNPAKAQSVKKLSLSCYGGHAVMQPALGHRVQMFMETRQLRIHAQVLNQLFIRKTHPGVCQSFTESLAERDLLMHGLHTLA